MFVLFTDFGLSGPHVGQLKSTIWACLPEVPIVDLMHDAPAFDPARAAYLLAAYAACLPADSVCVAVVDPGVGGTRRALAMHVRERWFVGPDNGLLSQVWAPGAEIWELATPVHAAPSFHGRDLFAPAAIDIFRHGAPTSASRLARAIVGQDWPRDLREVIYIDGYGNAVTGLRAAQVGEEAIIDLGRARLRHARTFSAVAAGEAFWYANSSGLVEFAVNQGRADQVLGVRPGVSFRVDA